MQIFGVRVYDRETKRMSNLHDSCAKWLFEFSREAGINPMERFTEMGPASADPDTVCDLYVCNRPLGDDAIHTV